MSEGERTSYEILAVQVGMAKQALCGNANATHAELRASCENRRAPPAPIAAAQTPALSGWLDIDAAHPPTCPVYHPTGDLRYPLCVCGIEAAREKARAELAALRSAAAGQGSREAIILECVREARLTGRNFALDNPDGTVSDLLESDRVKTLIAMAIERVADRLFALRARDGAVPEKQ